MNTTKVVSVSDVLAEAGSDVHGNCSKAALHQVPESETSLFSGQVCASANVAGGNTALSGNAVFFLVTPLDKRPCHGYLRILAHVKDMVRRHAGPEERGRCRGRTCSPLPGGLGISLPALCDRGARCFAGLGQAMAGNAR